MLSTTMLRRFIMNPWIIVSFFVFLGTWYDTTHAHVLTMGLNNWILEILYVPATATGQWQQYYFGLLEFFNVLGITPNFIVFLIVVLVGLAFGKQYKIMIYSMVFLISALAVAWLLKHSVVSMRPMFPLEHDSFPSGHVLRTSIICSLLWWFNQLRVVQFPDWTKILLIVAPLVVGYARIGLGYHWLSDVLASYAIVFVLFSLMRVCYESEPQTHNPENN